MPAAPDAAYARHPAEEICWNVCRRSAAACGAHNVRRCREVR
jgi:hypothetical protein